jgi:POT family proton-dependent oligopeptide transporter
MASRPDSVNSIQTDARFFGHPRGLATLFFTEMWERFSYYGMRAILILYLTDQVVHGGLGFNDSKAGAIYGIYASMVYLLCLGGGWIADRITGQRTAVMIGGILIAAGEFCLVVPRVPSFYSGIVLLMMGTGMLKGNVSTIVGQLYRKGDPRRDSGFSLFYMGINTGALISPFICGYIGEKISWRLGFGAAGVAMLAGLIQYLMGGKYLGEAGMKPASTGDPERDRRQKNNAILAVGAVLGLAAVLGMLGVTDVIPFTPNMLLDLLGWFLLGISVVVFAWMIFSRGWTLEERKRSTAILALFVASALFWGSFEQAGSSLNLFAERDTYRYVFGWEFPAGWFQFVEPVFVVSLAPVFAWLWLALGRKNKEPAIPTKFTLGLVCAGLAFVVMVAAASMAAGNRQVALWWLIGTYLLQALGELSLSPVGLSAMTKLAPDRAQGFVMGIWFLSTSIGNWLAGKAASLYSTMPLPTLFGTVALTTIAAAIVLAMLIKPTVRLMSGVR